MKERKKAVELIKKQFDEEKTKGSGCYWHYGRVELKELLDFIYEGEPESEEEMVPKDYDENRHR